MPTTITAARTKINTVWDLWICLSVRINKNRRQSTRVKTPLRLLARTMLYKAAPIPKLERIHEFLRLARLQKNTPTLMIEYGFLFSKNDVLNNSAPFGIP